MEPGQRLSVFLPKLHTVLVRKGVAEEEAAFICFSIGAGAHPRAITTLTEYQDAWVIVDAMEEILTTLDDGSEAAAWCTALAHRVRDFEVTHEAEHGYPPLNPGPPEMTDGPTGNA